jgi:hypothetical protein
VSIVSTVSTLHDSGCSELVELLFDPPCARIEAALARAAMLVLGKPMMWRPARPTLP